MFLLCQIAALVEIAPHLRTACRLEFREKEAHKGKGYSVANLPTILGILRIRFEVITIRKQTYILIAIVAYAQKYAGLGIVFDVEITGIARKRRKEKLQTAVFAGHAQG